MSRVDLFTTLHKGVRALLFDVASAAARTEVGSDHEVDLLGDRIEQAFELIEAHEHAEDAIIVPVLERLDPALAADVVLAHHETHAAGAAVRRLGREEARLHHGPGPRAGGSSRLRGRAAHRAAGAADRLRSRLPRA